MPGKVPGRKGTRLERELVQLHQTAGILVKPESPHPHFGYWAWYKAPRLMESLSKGRSRAGVHPHTDGVTPASRTFWFQ